MKEVLDFREKINYSVDQYCDFDYSKIFTNLNNFKY